MPDRERTPTERAFQRGTIYQLHGWRRVVMLLVGGLLRLYYRTLRFTAESSELVAYQDLIARGPVLMVTWHNRSLVIPAMAHLYYEPDRLSCLVSPSRMAAWEAGFYEWMGIRAVRGSSSRRAIAATRELLAQFQSGQSIGISPDGPMGPLYEWKRGAIMLARTTDAPILLVSTDSPSAWRPRTWDRHYVPLPFTRVRVRFRVLPPYSQQGFADDRDAARVLREKFLEITTDPFRP